MRGWAPVVALWCMDDHSLERLDFPRVRELLAGYALSSLGRGLAMHVQPVARLALAQRWLHQVDELQRLVDERGLPPFAGVSDIRDILTRCAPPLSVDVDDIARVGATLAATHAISAWLRDLPEDCPELKHVAERVGDFQSVADRIAAVIDDRGQVRDSASPKLRRIRAEIADAAGGVSGVVERLLNDAAIRRLLQYTNHTFHGDRIVLPLRAECRGRLPGIVHRTSDSGATLYVEPAELVELNNRISNLRSEEVEEINRLLWELAHEVHINSKEIQRTLEALAVIDLIAAKVRFAKVFDCRCPQLNDEGALSVRGARHPILVEMARQRRLTQETPMEVVPIDYRLGVDFNMLIITGPNTGGKTVTLKTVGLLSLMVQSGLPVPVGAGSEFGMFTNILIDVGDEQSMQQSLSTFSAHITQLLHMLRHAGPRALLLIDELCAGTDPDEGAAIGRAVLDELLRMNCRCVVTTHLGALKAFALTRPQAENACVDFDAESLRPTYHLRLGEPGSSNAIDIAGRLGLPKRLVLTARRNVSRSARQLQFALDSTRDVKRQAEDARSAAEQARLAADAAHAQAQSARQNFEQKQVDFETWLQRVVHLRPGDAVRIRNFDRDGRIVRMRLDLQRAEVDVGAFTVETPLADVLPPQTPAPPPRPQPPSPPPPPPRRERRPASGTHGGAHSGTYPAGARPRPAPHPGAARSEPIAPAIEGALPLAAAQPGPLAHDRSQHPAPPRPRPPADPRPRPEFPTISDAEAAALKPGDTIYVKRFHRDGRVVRVVAAKRIVVVDVGMLEVETPYSGLARRPSREPPEKAASAPSS